MNKMKCQIQSHNERDILTICCDKNCENKRLCCLTCIKKFHSTHADKLVDIEDMNEFIQKMGNEQVQGPSTHSSGQKQILLGLEKLSFQVNCLQKILKEKIEQKKQQNLQNYLQKFNHCQQQGINYWNQILQDLLSYVEIDDGHIKLTQSEEGQINNMEEQEIQIIQQSEQSLEFIINQISQLQIQNDNQVQMKSQILNLTQTQIPTQIIQIRKLCFDEKRKHKDIAILDQSTIKKIQQSVAMAFGCEGFNPNIQSYTIAFNIKKCSDYGYTFIGVGNEEGKIAPTYYFQNQNLGHGLYMIKNDGCTYHHTDGSLNQKKSEMSFAIGDKIQIKYDHVTKVLEFRKSSDQKTVVTMPITDMTKKLYPCAQLYYIDDEVQLVEY